MNSHANQTKTPRHVPAYHAQPPRSEESSQARQSHAARLIGVINYFMHHTQACLASVKQLTYSPIASLMTLAVIAITLALPVGLFLLLQNLQAVSKGWDNSPQISLYLKMNTSSNQAQELIKRLHQRADVAAVNYISPMQGLADFEKQSGLSDVLAQLPDNPLPAVIEVNPTVAAQAPLTMSQLLASLKQLPEVDAAQLDTDWVKRLYNIIVLSKRAVTALAAFLALAVLLIVGNTIRLVTHTYRADVEVIKLIGGSNAFIRRPFLYTGFFYGLLGGITAWLLVSSVLWWLNEPAQQLAALYHSQFKLLGLPAQAVAILLLASGFLGWLGSLLAVNKQLQDNLS